MLDNAFRIGLSPRTLPIYFEFSADLGFKINADFSRETSQQNHAIGYLLSISRVDCELISHFPKKVLGPRLRSRLREGRHGPLRDFLKQWAEPCLRGQLDPAQVLSRFEEYLERRSAVLVAPQVRAVSGGRDCPCETWIHRFTSAAIRSMTKVQA
jgi:hypothetical protein